LSVAPEVVAVFDQRRDRSGPVKSEVDNLRPGTERAGARIRQPPILCPPKALARGYSQDFLYDPWMKPLISKSVERDINGSNDVGHTAAFRLGLSDFLQQKIAALYCVELRRRA
jgi:hypothetical protein